MERTVPIQVLWSDAPFWENLACVIFRTTLYFEPAFFSIFSSGRWASRSRTRPWRTAGTGDANGAGCVFRTDLLPTNEPVRGIAGIGVRFWRVVYVVWFFLMLIFMLQYAMMLMKAEPCSRQDQPEERIGRIESLGRLRDS